jgi:hypothetical protein
MSKHQALAYRELVTIFLRTRGLTDVVTKPDRGGRFAPPIKPEDEVGDIQNLPYGVLLNTKFEHTRDVSSGLNEAARDALRDGKRYSAVSWHRPGRPAEQQIVAMTLGDFADLLAEKRATP